MKYIRYYIVTAMTLLLSGCFNEIPTEEVQGYWRAVQYHSASPNFEFFNGSTVNSSDTSLKTGRIEKEDDSVELFYWEKSEEGHLLLSVVASDCPTRPLTTCPTVANVEILSAPSEGSRFYWEITYDYLDESIDDVEYQAEYKKNSLKFKRLSNGEIYLNSANNPAFSSPYAAHKSGNNMSIQLEVLGTVTEVSANFRRDRQAKILHFSPDDEVTATETVQFPTLDGGTVDLDVTSTLASVTMVASKRRPGEGSPANKNYVLSWVIAKSIEFPDSVPPESVDLSGLLWKKE